MTRSAPTSNPAPKGAKPLNKTFVMALNFQLLTHVRPCPGGHRAACPACREEDGDRHGNHLFVGEDDRFGCAAFQGDGEHRRRIFALVGDKTEAAPLTNWNSRRQIIRKRRQEQQARQERNLASAAAGRLDEILTTYGSDGWRADLWDRSPIRLEGDAGDDWRMFLRYLFPTDSTIWIGEPWDSGVEKGQGHFKTPAEWLSSADLPGSRVAPATFTDGGLARSKENVLQPLYLVLESDELIGKKPETDPEKEANKSATAALFRWLEDQLHMRLAAVVDTGNRSLHGWFSTPANPQVVRELRVIANALRLDPCLFSNPAAPLRLPGGVHEKTGHQAKLLYLDHMN